MKHIARWVLIATMAAAAAACSMNDEKGGPAESTAANAGRVVDDSVITGKVKTALVGDPTTKAYQISVETFKGVVQLSGFVDSNDAKMRAEQVAETVDGVKDVKNELELRSRNN